MPSFVLFYLDFVSIMDDLRYKHDLLRDVGIKKTLMGSVGSSCFGTQYISLHCCSDFPVFTLYHSLQVYVIH